MCGYPITAELLLDLRAYARELMQEHRVPGVSLGLLAPEEQQTLALGVTSLENPLPVTADTLFQIGSISKTFTATAILRLVELGQLALDAPVRTYLPELRLADETVAQRLTMRHLLTHTAGFRGDVFMHTGDGDDALEKLVAALAHEPQVTPLGEVWSYNNAGFALAGRIVERITGQTFEQAMHDLLWQPLGLKHPYYFPTQVMTYRFAVGHVMRKGQMVVARPMHVTRNLNACGGISTSMNDLLRYAAFHLGGGHAITHTTTNPQLLAPDTLRAMHEPTTSVGWDDHMGLAWFVRHPGGLKVSNHGGATSGQKATLWLIPALGVAFASLTNAAQGGQLNNALTNWLLKHWLNTPSKERASFTAPTDHLSEYQGHYRVPNAPQGSGFTLQMQDSKLLFIPEDSVPDDHPVFARGDTPPPAPLTFLEPDRATIKDGLLGGTRLEFLRDPHGQVKYVRSSMRVIPRVE